MTVKESLFPQDVYPTFLSVINGISFTRREVDVVACLLSARGTSKIASFLSISPKTVVNHIQNILGKLEGHSREDIIDFIEKTHQLPILRKHYSNLAIHAAFEKSLKAILKLNREERFSYRLVCEKTDEYQKQLAHYLTSHLELVGLTELATPDSQRDTLSFLLTKTYSEEKIIYLLSEEDIETFLTSKPSKELISSIPSPEKLRQIFFILLERKSSTLLPKELSHFDYIVLTKENNYYFSFFELLQKLLPNTNLQKVISEFKDFHEASRKTPDIHPPQIELEARNKKQNQLFSLFINQLSFLSRSAYFLIAVLIGLSALGIGYLYFIPFKPNNSQYTFNQAISKSGIHPVRSDLILPNGTALLNRPELIEKLNNFFKDPQKIESVALIGIGGAGKTTLARQYAKEQRSSIAWELNAETQETLSRSFENLASALSQSEEDKKTLKETLENKNPQEKEEKIINLVREKLQAHPGWLLIYDNAENFTDIQKYFPHDSTLWGTGKVIITTRNSTIQNNTPINSAIQIGELTPDQKLTLFTQIMQQGNNNSSPSNHTKETTLFLNELPSFPLDVSVAAYYVKGTNTPLEKYISTLNTNEKDISSLQENILKETGGYNNTRYKIITLSLQRLIDRHKDFRDLLLLIGLLDSQNIPRDLLDRYKNPLVVDKFIYKLKKYSLITNESTLLPSTTAFSIHRSTQKICLAYLKESTTPEERSKLIDSIARTIGGYAYDGIGEENNLKIKLLASHFKKLLTHHEMLSPIIKGDMIGELGGIYFYLGDYVKSKELLEQSLDLLKKQEDTDFTKIAKIFEWFGNVNRELGNYKTAVELLEKSIIFYRKDLPKNQAKIAKALAYLGYAYRNLGEVKKAKGLLEESLIMHKKYSPDNHASIARVLGYLGHIHWILGDFIGAKKLHEESYKTYKTYCPTNEIGIARTLVYLGKTYGKLGEIKAAQTALEGSIKLYKKYYGENHIDVAWASLHLGGVYTDGSDYKKAKEVLERTLATYRKHYNDTHIDIAWVSTYLGATYSYLGEHEQAINLLEKSLKTYEKTFGKNHTDTAWVLTTLGKAYLLKGSLNPAEIYTQQALQIFDTSKHPGAYTSLEVLGEIYMVKLGQVTKMANKEDLKKLRDQATAYFTKALEIVKHNFPANSPHIKRITSKIEIAQKT